MNPVTSEKLFLSIDRISPELLWSVNELDQHIIDPAARLRTAEMLDAVISGLRHSQSKLVNPKEQF